jgi:hypothetical protein
MLPVTVRDGGTMGDEDREGQARAWLERLQAATAAKQSLVEYCRRHGLRPGEAYQWKRNLRSAGRWPEHPKKSAPAGLVQSAPPKGFARVLIAPQTHPVSAVMHLQVHLRNGRRAELALSDERQLPRVLALIEELP